MIKGTIFLKNNYISISCILLKIKKSYKSLCLKKNYNDKNICSIQVLNQKIKKSKTLPKQSFKANKNKK